MLISPLSFLSPPLSLLLSPSPLSLPSLNQTKKKLFCKGSKSIFLASKTEEEKMVWVCVLRRSGLKIDPTAFPNIDRYKVFFLLSFSLLSFLFSLLSSLFSLLSSLFSLLASRFSLLSLYYIVLV